MNEKSKKRLAKCKREIEGLLEQIKGQVELCLDDKEITQQQTRTLQNWVRSLTENVAEVSCIKWIHKPEKKK